MSILLPRQTGFRLSFHDHSCVDAYAQKQKQHNLALVLAPLLLQLDEIMFELSITR